MKENVWLSHGLTAEIILQTAQSNDNHVITAISRLAIALLRYYFCVKPINEWRYDSALNFNGGLHNF